MEKVMGEKGKNKKKREGKKGDGVLNLPALYAHTVILNMYGWIHGADCGT